MSDLFFTRLDYVNASPSFVPNDYGKILYHNHTDSFDTAIFGNSTAIAAIRDERLPEGCGNLGIAYGKMTDFLQMLEKRYIHAEKEVIITANYLSFLDPLETNDTYPWLRQSYTPYVFFNRKNTADYIKNVLKNFTQGNLSLKIDLPEYYFEKAVSKGHMSDDELKERMLSFDERFGHYTIDDFSENIEALSKIYDYCEKNGLNMRFVWMPVNPKYNPRPEYIGRLQEQVNTFLDEKAIDYIDYTDSFGSELFFDLGHISWEEGSFAFTEVFLKWLEN
ncbi:hypothetical protein LJB89_02470 [Tyzzerella sp. OttesenSCG-928-J15]|nr:hypothetical protein [Tyzzerella sp. OttesenSCG-928-J15]